MARQYIGLEPLATSNNEVRPLFIAAAGQTIFPVGYTPGFIDVYVNGSAISDYTASNGTSVILTNPSTLGDEVKIVARYASTPNGSYSQQQSDAQFLNKNGGTMVGPTVAGVDGDMYVVSTDPSKLRDGSCSVASGDLYTLLGSNAAALAMVYESHNFPISPLGVFGLCDSTDACWLKVTIEGAQERYYYYAGGTVGVAPTPANFTLTGQFDYATGQMTTGPAVLQTQAVNGSQLFGFRNKIINGNFDIWQRGTSFTPAASSSAYTIDRWQSFWNNATSNTQSQQSFAAGQTAVPNNPAYFLRNTIVGTAVVTDIFQPIENVSTFSGQTVTLSFYSQSSSSGLPFAGIVTQNFGSGGSANVDTAFAFSTTTTQASWTKYTATFVVPSISGKTYGLSNSVGIRIRVLGGTGFTWDIASVQLEAGSLATPFEQRPYGLELSLCQRYAWDPLAGNTGGSIPVGTAFVDTSVATVVICTVVPPVPMRAIPSLAAVSTNFYAGYPGALQCSALSINASSSASFLQLNATIAAGAALGSAHLLYRATTTGQFLLSAEL